MIKKITNNLEDLENKFCVMFERAGRENGESPEEWQEKLEQFILKREKRIKGNSYTKGYEDCLEEKYDKAKKHFEKKSKALLADLEDEVDRINGHYKTLKYSDKLTKTGFAILNEQQKQRRIGLKMAIRDFKKIIKNL